jgi:hypothetical protein
MQWIDPKNPARSILKINIMPGKNKLKDEGAHAAFVFTGKILKTNAALMKSIPPKNTVIMQVEHIIKAPALFASLTGHQVTVRFKKLPKLKKGGVITLFANGWIFGESIGLDAVGYSDETDKKTVASKMNATMSVKQDGVLLERLNSSEMGVVGKVVKIEKADLPDLPVALMKGVRAGAKAVATTKISEHDPNWHQATIKVDEVVKGQKGKSRVKVLFPKSDDVRWFRIHKYSLGQQGIWLLQKGKGQNPKGIAPKMLGAVPDQEDVFTTLHDCDYLPLNELGKVKSLMQK